MFPSGKITPPTQLRPDKGHSPLSTGSLASTQSFSPFPLHGLRYMPSGAYTKFPSSVQEKKKSDGISQLILMYDLLCVKHCSSVFNIHPSNSQSTHFIDKKDDAKRG